MSIIPSNFHRLALFANYFQIQSLFSFHHLSFQCRCLSFTLRNPLETERKMEILGCLFLPKPTIFRKFKQAHVPCHAISSKSDNFAAKITQHTTPSPICAHFQQIPKANALWIGAAGIALISLVGPSNAVESPFLSEPSNALSLPTWAIHVSSVAEW